MLFIQMHHIWLALEVDLISICVTTATQQIQVIQTLDIHTTQKEKLKNHYVEHTISQ